ncbi:glutaredoxin family protein [Saccharopolyspora erythraea]|uniref:glutaredoxin family protein n=1 Tax=Saccharopolyspora erythraea TaxID=1836 RepID=UPI001BABF555|nr:glutaredoxin family protein [Saccharopolyspora erythraea]QUH05294.1 glutaredoxin family protein [Saccharopolyspora erythraea]
MTGTAAHTVTVMVREDCHACHQAVADVERICGELGVGWHAEDVDTDPELRAEYGDRVPVILIDDVEHGFWKVEEDRFRAALAR